jgi:DNA-binding HxlR family transcriptional regulator
MRYGEGWWSRRPALVSEHVGTLGPIIEPMIDIIHPSSADSTKARTARSSRALEIIGERRTLMIVCDAFYGVRRFSDFQSHLEIPKAVLSARLTGIVNHDILERRADPEHAGRHLYELTAAGRDLWPTISALLIWGGRNVASNSREFTHAPCGTRSASTTRRTTTATAAPRPCDRS